MQAGWLVCAQLPGAHNRRGTRDFGGQHDIVDQWTSPGNGRSVTFVPERLFWLAKRSNSGLDRWFHWGFRGLAGRADESSTGHPRSHPRSHPRVIHHGNACAWLAVDSPLGSAP